MELLVLAIFVLFSVALVLLIHYYRRLFSDGRREYPREELLHIEKYLWKEWQNLVKEDTSASYLGIGIGAVLAFLFSYMGGLYGAHYESYFFHSAILPGLWFLGLPFLREQYFDDIQLSPFVKKLIYEDTPAFFGFTVMFMGKMLMVYGLYHALSFLWILFNYVVCLVLLLYRLSQGEKIEGKLSLRKPDKAEEEGNW
ncbi:MAG: hypothetical protein NZM25_00705 [Leptospiraceae bacterium]|nr:hypothetical protein [Leptospiraceae bacterium]MDW8306245.1 hypothetical protein [Leptospiraceae bacterium]